MLSVDRKQARLGADPQQLGAGGRAVMAQLLLLRSDVRIGRREGSRGRERAMRENVSFYVLVNTVRHGIGQQGQIEDES